MDGINIYTKAHITDANDQIGRIYTGQEELKVRRIGQNAMLEQDAVHIGCEADLAAHVLDVQGRQLSVKGLLDTGAEQWLVSCQSKLEPTSYRQTSGWQLPIREQSM